MRVLIALAVACLTASAAFADTLDLSIPAGTEAAFPLVGVHSDDAPSSVPIATTTDAGQVAFDGEGPVWISLGGQPARFGPFADGAQVAFGALDLRAPEGATARYGMFDEGAAFVGPVLVPSVTLLPSGRYAMRRDLGDAVIEVEVAADTPTALTFGAVEVAPGPFGVGSVYLASRNDRRVVASGFGDGTAMAVPSGAYLVAAGAGQPVGSVVVSEAEIAHLVSYDLRTEVLGSAEQQLVVDGLEIALPANTSLRLIGPEGMVATHPSLGDLPMSGDAPLLLWQNRDGTFPRQDGLAMRLRHDPPLLIAGGVAVVQVELPSAASLEFAIVQGDLRTEASFERVWAAPDLELPVPEGLVAGTASLHLKIIRERDGMELTGVLRDLAVHLPPSDLLSGLQVSQAGRTTVDLVWESAAPTSVNIYRDQFARPVHGMRPVAGLRFQDIGLSAGRQYAYRVCPVDALGLEGPCKQVEAATTR